MEGANYPWVIQGDISQGFPSIPHALIKERLGKVIKCERTLQVINRALLGRGHIDPQTKCLVKSHAITPGRLSGAPRMRSLLSNIVLNEFDKYMGSLGGKSLFYYPSVPPSPNPPAKGRGDAKAGSEGMKLRDRGGPALAENRRALVYRRTYPQDIIKKPSLDPPATQRGILYDYPSQEGSRLLYVRYADEFVIMIIGSKSDALNIRIRIKDYLLVECGFTLNIDKTLITNTKKEGFRFLEAHINRAEMVRDYRAGASLSPPSRALASALRGRLGRRGTECKGGMLR